MLTLWQAYPTLSRLQHASQRFFIRKTHAVRSPANYYSLSCIFWEVLTWRCGSRWVAGPRDRPRACSGHGRAVWDQHLSKSFPVLWEGHSSQGPTEVKHCVDPSIPPINDLVTQEKCQRMVVALPSPCFWLSLAVQGMRTPRAPGFSWKRNVGDFAVQLLSPPQLCPHQVGGEHQQLHNVWSGCFGIPSFPPPSHLLVAVVHPVLGNCLSVTAD